MSRSSADIIDLIVTHTGCRVVAGARVSTHARAQGEAGWPEALLADLPPKARVRVTLGDALLRYLVCRWPATLRGRLEREAWLAHQFRQVHDLDALQWRVAADADAIGAPFIACAMPRPLESEVHALVDRAGARLVSLSGQFIRHYNRHCHQMLAADGALAVLDGDRMTLGAWQAGRWTRIASQPVAAGDAAVAARELAQLKVTGEAAAAGTLYVCGGRIDAPAGWAVTALESA